MRRLTVLAAAPFLSAAPHAFAVGPEDAPARWREAEVDDNMQPME